MPEIGVPVHFTYRVIQDPREDLCQGDIIQPSQDIRGLLAEVHPHFTDPKYVAFLVLTQTCDLVRRGEGDSKARYINLAVVRPLWDVLPVLVDRICETARVCGQRIPGLYLLSTMSKAQQLLERIVNQNAQAEGVFYLHSDRVVRISEPCVALLQVNVAVRAHEHYERLLSARSGGLREQFQSKLGWLIGNLFSRVATEDWPADQRKRLIAAFLDESEAPRDPRCRVPKWVPREKVTAANKAGVKVAGMTPDQVLAVIEKHSPPPPKQEAIARAVECVKSVIDGVSEEQLAKIKDRLATDPVFESACK